MTGTPHFETLVDLFDHATTRYADRPLFGTKTDGQWQWLTYGTFAADVAALRAAMSAHGIRKGDRVAILANNRVEWAVACYATAGVGGQFVPMYEAQLPSDWQYILADSAAKLVFVANVEIAAKLEPLREALPALEHVVVLDPSDADAQYSVWLEQGRAAPVEVTPVSADDIAGFIYTSGTTGNPKGVLLSHGNLASNVTAIHQVFDMTAEDRSLSFLPWAHSFGQTAELHTLFSMGASMALAESVPKIVENLAEVRPTVLIAVPRIFNRIYDGLQRRIREGSAVQRWLFERALANADKRRNLREHGRSSRRVELLHRVFDALVFTKVRERFGGRLRFAVSGGAALSPEIARFVDSLGILVFEGYGLTETSPVVAANGPAGHRIGTVGHPLPGVRVVLDHEVTEDPDNGEIVVYGPNVMQGYYGLPDQTAQALTADGGFRTGDMGRLDEDGFLWITGRIKEQYKLENGKYVVPTPLEEKMKLAPLVANALVYGHNKPFNVALVVPDWEAVDAWAAGLGISRASRAEWLEDKLLAEVVKGQVDEALASSKHYEQPKRIGLVAEDFTTDNGMLTPSLKVKRRVVIARYGDLLDQLYG